MVKRVVNVKDMTSNNVREMRRVSAQSHHDLYCLIMHSLAVSNTSVTGHQKLTMDYIRAYMCRLICAHFNLAKIIYVFENDSSSSLMFHASHVFLLFTQSSSINKHFSTFVTSACK